MDLSTTSNATVTDDAVLAPSLDTARGLGASAVAHLAVSLVRVSAIVGLMSPLLLVAWLVL
jgi:hypothetical protein